ncbi:antibiotic biosynthesis monooxygenase family protein [Nocardia brevicatena]|uniref:antibiotic biosynthesis monooxygenase family protein n=1 Tax=Nocardia brevicatena TaxID=37327 RepID=UPI0002F4D95C|nr:antibiotic biosynthesis monooxygenase [Nocardia brevicatena]
MPATFINIIDVDPTEQQQLIEVLTEGTEQVIRHRPGFVSVTLLAALDGSKVLNVAQWATPEDAKATLGDPAAQAFAKRIADIGEPNAGVYKLVGEFAAVDSQARAR